MTLILGGLLLQLIREPQNQFGKAVDKGVEIGGKAVDGVAAIAEAFRQGTITQVFTTQMAEMQGTNKLQLTDSKEQLRLAKTSTSSTIWGLLPLPDVTVELSVLVHYVFFCDLNGTWHIDYNDEDKILRAKLPPLQWNVPSIDTRHLEVKVRTSWLRLGEDKLKEELIKELTAEAEQQAPRLAKAATPMAEKAAQEYIENWLLRTFMPKDPKSLPRIEIQFSVEPDEQLLLDMAAYRPETN